MLVLTSISQSHSHLPAWPIRYTVRYTKLYLKTVGMPRNRCKASRLTQYIGASSPFLFPNSSFLPSCPPIADTLNATWCPSHPHSPAIPCAGFVSVREPSKVSSKSLVCMTLFTPLPTSFEQSQFSLCSIPLSLSRESRGVDDLLRALSYRDSSRYTVHDG